LEISAGKKPMKLALALTAVLVLACAHGGSIAGDEAVLSWAALPVEAQHTERLIRNAGPFPHAKDGSVFANRERQLPRQDRGYYREYTVATPGARDRGARRIVCGGQPAHQPKACYYTADHYASFARIVGSADSLAAAGVAR